jgi:aminopeptidase-like protein
LYTIPDKIDAIPYVTSYYNRTWGFCLTEKQKNQLKEKYYRVVINSKHKQGFLHYGELIIPGKSDEEIFISTYICHPSMANNELSGPIVTTALARFLTSGPRKYTYRIVFIPETIGSIVYLSKNIDIMKAKTVAGFNVTCIGDERCYSYLPSRDGNTYADKIAKHVLQHIDSGYNKYTWLDRGSDERQYCAPHVDLPIATIMRSKYGEYPEYHTSLDNFEFVTAKGLEGGYTALKKAIEVLEQNEYPVINTICEPQLGKRGLYNNTNYIGNDTTCLKLRKHIISMCDGKHSILDMADTLCISFQEVHDVIKTLDKVKLISYTN